MTTDYDALLLPLFQKLLKAGVSVGLSEYLLAIETLRDGIGLEDAATFQRICRLLWTKSQEDQVTFDLAFAELVWPRLQFAPVESMLFDEREHPFRDKRPSDITDSPLASSQSKVTDEDHIMQGESSYSVSPPPPFHLPSPPPSERRFHYTPRLPISIREMAERWRQLRRFQREGPDEEVDIEGTIRDICRVGIFRGPVLRPRVSNKNSLLLLIDQRGSMAPFSLLIDALLKSFSLGELKDRHMIYYFHNYPDCKLYEDPQLTAPHDLEQVLVKHAMHSRVLIVSDAGAARTFYSEERLSGTKKFLKKLNRYTYLYTWLNPLPTYRWKFTTAEDIADLVTMFPLNKEGLNDAISVLQGKLVRYGVGPYA